MTLIITAITAEGIVMGADSAITIKWKEDEIPLNLTNFKKIYNIPKLHLSIGVAGNLREETLDSMRFISEWLTNFIDKSQSESFTDFANELKNALNFENMLKGDRKKPETIRTFQLVSWVEALDENKNKKIIPRAVEISNLEGQYKLIDMLPKDFVVDIIKRREGKLEKYPIRLLTIGVPYGYANWISTTGIQEHTNFVDSQVPYGEITSIAEYVRFLIRSIAELHRIARKPQIVGEPIETVILFPDFKNMISLRY